MEVASDARTGLGEEQQQGKKVTNPFDVTEEWGDQFYVKGKCDPNDPDVVEYNMQLRRELAEKALKYYNDTQGADYELVRLVGVCGQILPAYNGYHLNFEAKPKNSNNESPRKFFAEVCEFLAGDCVNRCTILDSSDSSNDICSICDETIAHPSSGKFFFCPAARCGGDHQCAEAAAAGISPDFYGSICHFCGRLYGHDDL